VFWLALGALLFFTYSGNKILFWVLLAGWLTAWFFIFKTTAKKLGFILSVAALLLCSWGLINSVPVQNFLVKKVAAVLSKKLQTRVSINHVDFSLFNKMDIEGVLVLDKKLDTLLYAGTAKVNITDWFFIKDKATLKYLGLKNTFININRTDSAWNYQFLIDYFSTPKKSNSTKKELEFDFKVVELENLRLNQVDKWVGRDMGVSVQSLYLSADSMDLPNNIISINTIRLNKPVFYQNDYTGIIDSLNLPSKTVVKTATPGPYKWNNNGLLVSIKNLLISDGSFKNEKETIRLPYTDRFDGQHLLFTGINGSLKNILLNKDTITTEVYLATKEKSGFEIKKLQSKLKFTPDIMEFSNLDLVTNKSRLGNYYSMRYDNFNADMSDFLHSVTLEGKFDNSHINSDDIAFFAPQLKTWKQVFEIKGNAKGTIDNLVAKKMLIKSNNTTIDGDIALRGLPNIKQTFIDFKGNNLVTDYKDLVTLIPSLKGITQPNLAKLGVIGFKGNFTGFINDFVTYGTITTDLGTIVADINMKLPENKPSVYSGKISSGGFKLGQFINNNQLGNIAMDGNINGSGFTLKTLQTNFKGNIRQLDFSGYQYNNIAVDGNFNKQVFTGHGTVNDPNLNIENFNGAVSLSGKEPAFNFDAVFKKVNLKKLHLTNEDFSFNGHFNLNFTGNTIDNFLGNAKVYNATLFHNNTKLAFDSLLLQSFIADNKKYLSFQSNELEGNVTGNFKILELPAAFTFFLSRYYPAYIKPPSRKVSNQDFSFLIKTKNVDEYTQLADKKLKGFNDATISGSLNLAQSELNVNATIPQFEYDKKVFNDVVIKSRGNIDTLNNQITTGDIVLNDSLHFPGTTLSIKSHNDLSAISLKTSASKTLNEAELNASIQTLSDGVKIYFSPSSFIVNEKKWELEKNGELSIRKSYIDASEIKFVQGNQEIVFSTEPAEDGTDNTNIVATLKKVNLDDFIPLFLKQPRLEGVVTGTATLKDVFRKPVIEFDALTENFSLDNREMGAVKLKGDINTTTGLIRSKASADNELFKFNIDGSINFKDSTSNQMSFDFLSDRFDVSILNNYLGGIFSNMKGDVVSSLKVYGGNNHRYVTGNATINDGSLKVNYTQCQYNFTNETIIFNRDEIDLGTMQLKDTLKNTGTASGKIYHNFFQDFSFGNLKFETDKMLLLNTNVKDNSQFYGKVIGDAVMTLNGPVTDMMMKIDGEPSVTDSSHIYLPTGGGREVGAIDYIDFIEFGTKMEDVKSKGGTNIFVDMDLRANPACKIDVILDEATGDVIKGYGNGLLNITVGTRESPNLRGRYDITGGEYKFNFQTFLKRYFNIKRGSITWNGDPFDAAINIDAIYLAPKVNLSNLTSSSGKQLKQQSDLNIIAHLTKTLKEPEIKFDFELPAENDIAKDPIVLENLKKFTKDDNEMNRQVASLLLFNSFISDKGGLGGSTASFLSGTAGQVISGFLSNQFSRFFQKVFKDNTITPYLSLNSSYDATSPELIKALQASGNFGVKKEYFKGRLIFTLGGNIDYNNPYVLIARNTNVLLTPDFNVEYILTKDRKLRIVGFKRTSVDATLGQRSRTGVRLSYQKEFDKLTREEKMLRRDKNKKGSKNRPPAQ
jgi:TamB, inner membrane protein subunit of TAM complex